MIVWNWILLLPLLGIFVLGGVAICIASRKKGGRVRLACTITGGVCLAGIALFLMLSMLIAPRQHSVVSSIAGARSEVVITDIDEQHHRVSRTIIQSPKAPDHVPRNVEDAAPLLDSLEPWEATTLAGIALLILVVLAWLFLDAGRRGGYAWPIRITTAIVFVGLCGWFWEIGPLM